MMNFFDKNNTTVKLPESPEPVYIRDQSNLERVVSSLQEKRVVALDTETTGLDPYLSKVILLQLASDKHVFIIDCRYVNPAPLGQTVLENSEILKVIQHAKFDYKMLRNQYGFDIHPIFDTMLAEQLLNLGRKGISANLKALTKRYLGVDVNKDISRTFLSIFPNEELSTEQVVYAGNDVYSLLQIFLQQVKRLRREELIHVSNLEFDVVRPLSHMELAGCLVDEVLWRKTIEKLQGRRKDLGDKVFELLPHTGQESFFGIQSTLNIDSQQQLLKRLQVLTEQGLESTAKGVLKSLDHPVAEAVLNYREVDKLVKAFGFNILQKIHPVTGRLHSDYKQLGTATGRMSCSFPNLQQIPTSRDSAYRSCFIAPKGYKLITFDYSQQELRILASVSRDPVMIAGFEGGRDFHKQTAALIFDKSFEDVTADERKKAKTVNFLVIYGGGALNLALQLGIKEKEAQRIIDGYFKAYPKAKQYIEEARRLGVSFNYSKTVTGRRRYYDLPGKYENKSDEYKRQKFAVERRSANHPIQGGAADCVKKAMVYVFETLKQHDARMILQVHDELVVEVREDQVKEVEEKVKEDMKRAFNDFFPYVPIVVDSKISHCWEKD